MTNIEFAKCNDIDIPVKKWYESQLFYKIRMSKWNEKVSNLRKNIPTLRALNTENVNISKELEKYYYYIGDNNLMKASIIDNVTQLPKYFYFGCIDIASALVKAHLKDQHKKLAILNNELSKVYKIASKKFICSIALSLPEDKQIAVIKSKNFFMSDKDVEKFYEDIEKMLNCGGSICVTNSKGTPVWIAFTPKTIDIDLLSYGGDIFNSDIEYL